MRSLPRATLAFLGSSIGKKTVVALTGLALLLFLAGHLAGNLLIYRDPREINAYAYELHHLLHGSFIWIARISLLLFLILHVYFTISLSRENRSARGSGYAQGRTIQATLASRTMILSGLVILAFVVFHLLHFTVRTTHPEFEDLVYMLDGKPVHDVHSMVVLGFQNKLVSGFYIVSMALLCAHLSHGFASVFQTLGVRSGRTQRFLKGLGVAYAVVIFLGNISIPISIMGKLGPFAGS